VEEDGSFFWSEMMEDFVHEHIYNELLLSSAEIVKEN
jgi:hypothetical protein